jgi:hypothetical protein
MIQKGKKKTDINFNARDLVDEVKESNKLEDITEPHKHSMQKE